MVTIKPGLGGEIKNGNAPFGRNRARAVQNTMGGHDEQDL